MKIKYIVIGSKVQYWEIPYYDLFRNNEVHVFMKLRNRILNNILETHCSYRLNRIISVPFQGLWCSRILPSYDKVNSEPIFVFSEGNCLSYNKHFLRQIKKIYPNSYFSFVLSNPLTSYVRGKLNSVDKYYDLFVSFVGEPLDEKWVIYKEGVYSKVSLRENDYPSCDLFFVGAAKERMDFIIEIYDEATQHGLKCEFFIFNVPPEKQVQRDGITYNKYLSYYEVLQRVQKSKGILEILDKGYQYASLRTFEAITYNTILITTNREIVNSKYYHSQNMHVIINAFDIRNEWFSIGVSQYNIDISCFSPNRLLESIEEKVR